MSNRVTGYPGITQEACHAQHCCFQSASASTGQQSRCYWPYNAEISAYHAVEVSRQGLPGSVLPAIGQAGRGQVAYTSCCASLPLALHKYAA
jgi:hypothetical protein